MALKHYVCFLSPGSLFPNEQRIEVASREEKVLAPTNCFAYYFFDREEIEKGGEKLVGKEKNKSGRFYFGTVMTAEEIEADEGDNKILLSNMSINNWPKVVKTRMGNYQPLEKGDTVLTVS